MALFHLSVTQTKRSAGQSAIASAAYRAGERLYSEYYGEYSDYTRKGGVICSDILLPSHAPPEYADRQTLWNAVEKAERGKNAQLAYSFDIALQNEFSLEENIALARQFLLEQFVSRGMVVDFAVHQPDREDGGIPNPHFHVLCPIRPIEQNGKWGCKQHRVYELDEDGNRIRDADGNFVFNAVPTTDWGSPETLEYWRQTWAELCNAKFAEKGLDVRDTPLTLADERIARAIRENNARLVIIDPVQAFLGADVDMNRANEVRPIFRSLGDIAQATGCAIVLIGHLNKAAGTQSTYRGLGSIDITAAVRSLLFIGKLKDSPTTRVLIHEKSSLAPPGQSLAFSLGDEKGFEWIGAYDITADELLAGTDTAKTESKTAQAQMLILELLADGKRMPSAELEKAVNERGISSRTMRTAKSRIGDRLVTEKDGTAWVCYLRD